MKTNLFNKPSFSIILLALFISTSCEEDTSSMPEIEIIEQPGAYMPATNTNPESISAFSDALAGCKLQSSYDNSGTSTTDYDTDDIDSDFYFATSNNWLVFRAHEGSSERTELRDLWNRKWDDYHVMNFKAVVEEIPNGDGVTIGQVHNDGSGVNGPICRIYVTRSKVRMKFRTGYSNSNNDYINSEDMQDDLEDAGLTYGSNNDGNNDWGGGELDYSEGQVLSGYIDFYNGYVFVYIKNHSNNQTLRTRFKFTSQWKSGNRSGNFYFKCGAYNQGTHSEPTRVSFNYIEMQNHR